MDFLVIDFETATSKNSSACSLGMVFVSGEIIMHEKYYLIRPPELKVDRLNEKIHGLTVEDLRDAPTFDVVWKEISHFFHPHCFLVAHNAQFDFSVLKSCLNEYGLKYPDFNYFCSIPFSGRVTRGSGVSKSLKSRADYFSIDMDRHHNALSDAKTCAQLVLKSMKVKGISRVDDYLTTFSSIPVKSFSMLKAEETFVQKPKFKNRELRITEFTPNTEFISVSHPLFGKTIAYTGELTTMTREDAMQKAVDLGAVVRSSVSGKTDYLVAGERDSELFGLYDLSGKEQKALNIIADGGKVRIIDENEYLSLLSSPVNSHL